MDCKPEPPKFPSPLPPPAQRRAQVDHIAAAVEDGVSREQDVPPGCGQFK
ncbi:MAG: hypothetical protein H0W85_08240 [Methylotenera sp.]|nr:hypothetical protein [Methylotenera sp.]